MWGGNCSSKFYKRLGIYKNSGGTYTFNPETCEAYSYRHWPLLKRFGGWLVLNNRSYSVTTARHVSVLRCDMRERKLDADLIVDTGSNSAKMTAETVLLALVRDAHKDAKAFAKDNKLSYIQAVKEVKRERKEQAENIAKAKARRKAESLERRSLDKTWKEKDTIVSVECFSG